MTDWLKETYESSNDKPQKLSSNFIYRLAELFDLHNGEGVDENLKSFFDPFMSNMPNEDKDRCRLAAKLTGVEIQIKEAKYPEINKDHFGLYGSQKGLYDYSSFWKKLKELRENDCS